MISNSYNKYLCSFADTKLEMVSKRFINQAIEMNCYDHIYIYNETLLDDKFIDLFKDKLPYKGFGYWSWKPQIILQTFNKMNYGDILQYSDAGCHLNRHGKKRLEEYFEITNLSASGFLAFNMPKHKEKAWTKGDLFDFFECRNQVNITNTGQFIAGIFFVKKTYHTEMIINEWMDIFIHHFNLIDDSPSISDNFIEFIQNRHDQSAYSMLAKKYHFESLEHGIENYKYYANYPVLALRDLSDGRKWMRVLSHPKILRGLVAEKKFKKKLRVTIEVLAGQKLYLLIRKLYSRFKV